MSYARSMSAARLIVRARGASEVTIGEVQHAVGGHPRYFEVTVSPIFDDQRTISACGLSSAIDDDPSLAVELNASKQELEPPTTSCSRRTKSSRPRTKSCSRPSRLETTNEELQATNEELEP